MDENINLRRIYYSHSKRAYGTPQETQEIEFLKKKFPNTTIICPNATVGELNDSQDYLHIVDCCSNLIASEIDGYISKGVFSEIARAFSNDISTFVLRRQANEFYLLKVSGIEIINESKWKNNYGKLIVIQ